MSRRLEGKNALVTGSTRGLGAVIARAFAREGARVAVTGLPPEKGREVAAAAGCTAVIHPGGSKGDEAVLAAAAAHGMAVVLTGVRHLRH